MQEYVYVVPVKDANLVKQFIYTLPKVSILTEIPSDNDVRFTIIGEEDDDTHLSEFIHLLTTTSVFWNGALPTGIVMVLLGMTMMFGIDSINGTASLWPFLITSFLACVFGAAYAYKKL